MSDGMLRVNFGALHQAGADIHKAISKLESELSQLEQDAAPLVATWSGAAKDAYAERQRRWQSASHDLKNILREIKGAVDASASDYQDTERKAQSRFQ
jgi:early secretory antigenic target protein ESAT-6